MPQPRRQTTTPAEMAARRLLRAAGFRVEAVSMIRGHNEEFAAVVTNPGQDLPELVLLLTDKRNTTLDITRIHVGKYQVRTYVAFAVTDRSGPPVLDSWDKIEAAFAREAAQGGGVR